MKKKNEVYVVVDTPKKAKKLAKVLDMFGEPLCGDHSISCALLNKDNGWVIKFIDREEWGTSTETFGLKEVTIKELRNILAEEHLNEGDVVVFGIEGSSGRYIGKYECFINNYFSAYYKPLDSKESLTDNTGYFDNFIRYATEEEKALLNPVKELEVGKWYKRQDSSYLAFMTDLKGRGYGFDINGNWFEGGCGFSSCKEATPQEVESALIKEAKKRYRVGDILAPVEGYNDFSNGQRFFTHDLSHQPGFNDLWIGNDLEIHTGSKYSSRIFYNGKWADVVKEAPKFEVKIDMKCLRDSIEKYNKELSKVDSKLYYRIKPSGRIIFNRSIINLTRGYGDWKEYTGQDINELI